MTEDYPIQPGSPVDLALNSYARHVVRDQPFNPDAWHLINLADPAHMLAFGTRIFLMQTGVLDPSTLVYSLHAQWHGQAQPTREPVVEGAMDALRAWREDPPKDGWE